MLTNNDLIAAGYKPFTQRNLKEFTNSFYQKRFDDENGKKYFITVAEYDNSKYLKEYINLSEFSYEADCQFVSNGVTFNVDMLNPESIQQMEEFFEKMWYNLGCEYYELFGY